MKAFALLLLLAPLAALAQGPLVPPVGPPAPSMKTLEQIEARTPIESLPYVISNPGSYYLARSLQFTAASGDAISITSDNVTLDLNGFTLSSSAGVTGHAIKVGDNRNNIAIKNGNVAGNTTVTLSGSSPNQTWVVNAAGFQMGVNAESNVWRNMTVQDLQVSGCRNTGIHALYGAVTRSTVSQNGGAGINAKEGGFTIQAGSATDCSARFNGGGGILAGSVSNSTTNFNGGGGTFATTVTGSTATSNGGDGILAFGSVTSCTATGNDTSPGTYYDLNATNAVIAFTKFGTGNTTGSTLTGNKTP